MAWQFFIALRYLTAKRREKFISLISLISILGVAVGVAALIIVISVMTGFDEDLKEKIVGTYSHLEILSDYGIKPAENITDDILKTRHVMAASYFLNGQALMRKGENVTGVIVKGIIPENEIKVKKLGEYMKKGTLELNGDGMVIGSELANKLNARIGDTVVLISPSSETLSGKISILAPPKSVERRFKITGIFTSGMYEYDMNLVYIDIAKSQELFGAKDLVSGVAVRVDDIFNVAGVRKDLQAKFGLPYMVRTWADSNRNLLEAIKLEKTVMFIILTLIVMVACFNIASALIMTVLEKTKDIGILKAIGAKNSDVMMIFAMQGGMIGFLGTLLGSISGVAICWCLKTYKFITLPRDVYYIDKLPVKLDIRDISVIVISSILISLVASLYPARKAAGLDPVEALRYE